MIGKEFFDEIRVGVFHEKQMKCPVCGLLDFPVLKTKMLMKLYHGRKKELFLSVAEEKPQRELDGRSNTQ